MHKLKRFFYFNLGYAIFYLLVIVRFIYVQWSYNSQEANLGDKVYGIYVLIFGVIFLFIYTSTPLLKYASIVFGKFSIDKRYEMEVNSQLKRRFIVSTVFLLFILTHVIVDLLKSI